MQFYKEEKDRLVCLLCSYYCKLKKDQVGICGVNKNVGNKIECLVYGHISAINIDPIEKKPLYHFLPQSKSLSLGTVGCNFRCSFCQNHGISQEKRIDKSKYLSPKDVVNLAIKNQCKSISYTYNEPTIFYPYAKDIAIMAKKYGIKSVYVTNGFESKEVIDDMKGIIDAVNVDLKCFDENYYKKELGGNLNQVLENLKHFKKNGIWVEITTLVVPTKNDTQEQFSKIAKFIKEHLDIYTPWHISSFHPDYKELDLPRTSFESLKKAYEIGKKEGLKHVYIGNIGFENNSNCPNCNETLISRVQYKVSKNIILNQECPKCKRKFDGVYEKMNNIRKSFFSGTFYPNNKDEIVNMIEKFNKDFTVNGSFDTKAIIVPHAGYVYSGFTANIAYFISSVKKPKRVIVIGPSHKVYLHGASIALNESYETPLGNIKIDLNYANYLKEKFDFLQFNDNVHQEHSTETQAPFSKYYFPQCEFIEIIYGKMDFRHLSLLIDELWEDDENFVLISTDLSHFYTLDEAKKLDNICLNAIAKKDLELFDKGCEACGKLGVKAVINSAIKKDYKTQILHYCTSFDRTKDANRVVGYTSVLIGK